MSQNLIPAAFCQRQSQSQPASLMPGVLIRLQGSEETQALVSRSVLREKPRFSPSGLTRNIKLGRWSWVIVHVLPSKGLGGDTQSSVPRSLPHPLHVLWANLGSKVCSRHPFRVSGIVFTVGIAAAVFGDSPPRGVDSQQGWGDGERGAPSLPAPALISIAFQGYLPVPRGQGLSAVAHVPSPAPSLVHNGHKIGICAG